ncbi:LOW QUALITY PROTEIN: WD repeat-containing protein 97 [Tenrec ecaudatus]|uniref:LOW QUALITY PROTEIN: WD repeat-containing protein 97 n=1 Tax=Tenrec ecaudatus TaxID=94439 RepID=UPI003F5A61B1
MDLYDTDASDRPEQRLFRGKNECFRYPHAESLFSEPTQFLRIFTTSLRWLNMSPRSRAQERWLRLRRGLHDLVEKEKKAEMRMACLTHGLEPLRRLDMAAGLCSVAQDPLSGRLVVLDSKGVLHLHKKDGWAKEKLGAPAQITGLVAVLGTLGAQSRFVGWGPAGLVILGPTLRLLWQSQPGLRPEQTLEPTSCLPVPNSDLIVVARMDGALELWKFRLGGRFLVPLGPCLQPPRSIRGTLARMTLGSPQPCLLPRCFAAYGTAVLTFDLHSWALVDVHRDLHKNTISDLAYCEEVKAMVTASRDSTVKVWEPDWQIRTVFVGHTGPVTALAVLPNTALVLSASQDGTLRTWDLQAVAQVGEVALGCWGQNMSSGPVSTLLAPASPGWPVLSLSNRSVELWRIRELYSLLAQLPAQVLHLQVVPALPAHLHPLPMRLVCTCADGSVCLVSANTGRTVTALLLGPDDCAVAVAYCLPCEVLWLLTRTRYLVRANAAFCPMRVLDRVPPPPAPTGQPCCLHLYSHLTDARSARNSWEATRQCPAELYRGNTARALKDKNRYLPVVGHTDGQLSVLEWYSTRTVFRTAAHSPGPVTAIASTWNCLVSSGEFFPSPSQSLAHAPPSLGLQPTCAPIGGDLVVKMWRVFPYAEESLSLLRTFSCCHPVVALCVFGKHITVGFEAPATATYGLVQLGMDDHPRHDHQPQDDPTDHITGLVCCPALKLLASASLDCTIRIWTTENRLLRLLKLNGAPQALTFCNDSGDLVLALGSRLCLVPHKLYLPTSYLVEKLCQKAPDFIDDPPLPLTSQESLTSAQLQKLASLRGSASLSATMSFIHQYQASQQPVVKEDFEALRARDQDLRRLRQGLVVPAAHPPPSWQLRQEAFDNYLRLIYGSSLVGSVPATPALSLSMLVAPSAPGPPMPTPATSLPGHGNRTGALSLGPYGAPCGESGSRGLQTSQVRPSTLCTGWACSGSRSSSKRGLIMAREDSGQWVAFPWGRDVGCYSPCPSLSLPSHPQIRLKRRPKELLCKLTGFFPATLQPPDQFSRQPVLRPIPFPGFIPNSVVLQHLWLATEMVGLGALAQLSTSQGTLKARGELAGVPSASLSSPFPQTRGSLENVRLRGSKGYHAPWQHMLLGWLGGEEEAQLEEEEEDADMDELYWASTPTSLVSQRPRSSELLERLELQAEVTYIGSWRTRHSVHRGAGGTCSALFYSSQSLALISALQRPSHVGVSEVSEPSPGEERCVHLPRFLHYFLRQSWFKRLFPAFTLEAYPEMGTMEGMASLLASLLKQASWGDGVDILNALLILLPDTGCHFRSRLKDILLHLLNQDPPPSLQNRTQKQFVMLSLQLLLACSLEIRDLVLELLSYALYSPAACQPELKMLLSQLGLQDPNCVLSQMMTWVQGSEHHSKALLRKRCNQKLECMIQKLQVGAPLVRGLGVPGPTAFLRASLGTLSEARTPPSVALRLDLRTDSAGALLGEISLILRVAQARASGSPQPVPLSLVGPSFSQPMEPEQGLPRASISQDLSHIRFSGSSPSSLLLQHISKVPLTPGSTAGRNVGAQATKEQLQAWRTRQALSRSLQAFAGSPAAAMPQDLMLLPEQTGSLYWQQLDLESIDALNYFCEQLEHCGSSLLEEPEPELPSPEPLRPHMPNTVVRQPLDRWYQPIRRLQESRIPATRVNLKGRNPPGICAGGPLRLLKLPLPRVQLGPFPADWPTPARPLPPLLLQPALQRYFLPEEADPAGHR